MLLNFRLIFGIEAMNRPSCCDLIQEVVFSGEHLNLADKKKKQQQLANRNPFHEERSYSKLLCQKLFFEAAPFSSISCETFPTRWAALGL